MIITALTRKYWIDSLLGLAEERLSGPEFDECRTALDFDALTAHAEATEAALAGLILCTLARVGWVMG